MTKEEIGAHLKPFQTEPSFLQFRYAGAEESADSQFKQILDSVELVRYNPHLDADGEITRVDFWLLWMPAWFDQMKPHVIKCFSVEAPDSYIRDFKAEKGTLHLEVIEPIQEAVAAELWAKWQKARKRELEYYEELKARNIRGAKGIANSE